MPRWEVKKTSDGWQVVAPSGSGEINLPTLTAAGVQILRDAATYLQDESDPSRAFSGPVAFEGQPTSDGRFIMEGALTWRTPPLPLMLQTRTEPGHFGAELAGRIDRIFREGDQIIAEGVLDSSEAGERAFEVLSDHDRFGVSVDLGAVEADFVCVEEDDEGICIDGTLQISKGELMGATLTPFPAFADAHITLGEEELSSDTPKKKKKKLRNDDEDDMSSSTIPTSSSASSSNLLFTSVWHAEDSNININGHTILTACAVPHTPPSSHFTNPSLPALQRYVTMTEDGRIYGHLAGWGECHIGYEQVCVTPPHSSTSYSHFMCGTVLTDDSSLIPTGPIAISGGHANDHADARTARAHYDNTDTAVADVAVGEDEYGIWFSGALRSDITDEEIRILRASGVSGDWRKINNSLELVGICSVNVPGFPKVRAHLSNNEVMSLVAAGPPPAPAPQLDPSTEQRISSLERRLDHLEALRRLG